MPLLWLSTAFIAGLILGNYVPWTPLFWPALAAASLIFWLLFRRLPIRRLRWLAAVEPRLFVPPILLVTFLALGAWRITTSGPDLAAGHIAAANDQGAFRIVAVVSAPPDRRERSTLYRLRVEQVTPLDESGAPSTPAQPAHGNLLALVPGKTYWAYGDRLELEGNPATPPENEDFSYRAYLARQDVYTYLTYPRVRLVAHEAGNPLYAAIYRLRDWAYVEINHLYPAPESALLSGILLGLDGDLPDALAQAYRDTGTAHVIAISGFNIAILIQLFSKIFEKFLSRWWATLIAILAVFAYTLMVGATASVVRAAIMGSLALIASQIGRRSAGASVLALTAGLMCLPTPRLPWDVSFQLSFGATLGLILYGERFQQGFTRFLERRISAEKARKIAAPTGEYLLTTLAAQTLTLPVILYHFQRLSISSLLANPLILPVQPLVMVLSGIAVIAGAISDPLAHLLAWLAWPFSAYTNRVVELLAEMPGGVLVLGELSLGSVILICLAVLAPVTANRLPEMLKRAVTPVLVLTTLGLAAVLAWRGVWTAPDGRLRLLVFDLQGSQVLLIRGPSGETLLINSGPSARQLNNALDRWLSPFDRRLDGLLLNTGKSSALNGLPGMLETHPVGKAWWGSQPPDSHTSETINELLRGQGAAADMLAPGDVIGIGQEVRIQVVAKTTEGSAFLLTWDRFRVLIPGGAAPGRLAGDPAAALSAIILSSRDLQGASADAWLALAPQAIVFTPEEGALSTGGINWINTAPGGWVKLETNGKRMWVERSR